MISNDILDALIPLPTMDGLMEEVKADLTADGFPLTNYKPGGVFYTLLRIALQPKIDLIRLARTMLGNMFVSHAQGSWLELKGGDFALKRKEATKATGVITLSRTVNYPAVRIAKGHVFKTGLDASGTELRYLATAPVVLQNGQTSCTVPVEAELPGSVYNVPAATITYSLTHIESITTITNAEGWLTSEGSDQEELEAYRSRLLNIWADKAVIPVRQTYQNACEAVPGVLFARVVDTQPRGQGTIDVIITSTAGAATEALLAQVTAAIAAIKGPYDNFQVTSSTTVPQDVTVVLKLPANLSDEGIIDKAKAIIAKAIQVGKGRNLNELYVNDLVYMLRSGIPTLRNVTVTTPAADVVLDADKVITLGTTTVTIERV